MIQRIQTIFLLLASGSAFSLFLKPMDFFEVDNNQGLPADAMLYDKVFEVNDHIIMLVLVVLAGILALVGIFLFKQRDKQMMVSRLVTVVGILIMVLAGILFTIDYNALTGNTNITGDYGLLSPILLIVFAVLATRFIKKDENLVRSMDRLR